MAEAMIAVLTNGPEYENAHVSNSAYITGLYNDIFGRDPKAADIDYWSSR